MAMRRSFLDEIDHNILNELHKNARISLQTLARQLQISASTLHYRIHRLEEEKIIQGYHARINLSGTEDSFKTSLLVSVNLHNFDEFDQLIRAIPEIEYASQITGNANYLLIIRCKNYQEFLESVYHRIIKSKLVSSIESYMIVRGIK